MRAMMTNNTQHNAYRRKYMKSYRQRNPSYKIGERKRMNKLRNFLTQRMLVARANSKKIGREFTITIDDLLSLWESQKGMCAYSGQPMTHAYALNADSVKRTKNPHNVSIDRKDSSKGYTRDNIVLCCWVVNSFKSDLGSEAFQLWVNTLAAHPYFSGNSHLTFATTQQPSTMALNFLLKP